MNHFPAALLSLLLIGSGAINIFWTMPQKTFNTMALVSLAVIIVLAIELVEKS